MLNPLWTKTERKHKSISNCASWWRLFRLVSCDRTKNLPPGSAVTWSMWSPSQTFTATAANNVQSASFNITFFFFSCTQVLHFYFSASLSGWKHWFEVCTWSGRHAVSLISNSWHCMWTLCPWSHIISVNLHATRAAAEQSCCCRCWKEKRMLRRANREKWEERRYMMSSVCV